MSGDLTLLEKTSFFFQYYMPQQVLNSPDSSFQAARHSKSQTDQWLTDRQLEHLIPVFRRYGIKLSTLWRCSESELYEWFCSAGLSKGESISIRDRVVLDRHWRDHLLDCNVFEELIKLVEEETDLTINSLEFKDVKAEVDKACDKYLESCKTAVEDIRKETHERVEEIRESTEKRARMLQKARPSVRKHLSNQSRGIARDSANTRIKQIIEELRPGNYNRGFSIKPIYKYKEPHFEMLKRCLKRKLSSGLDQSERWDEKNLDHDIGLTKYGSKAVKIKKDRISDVRGAMGHTKGIHTWFMRVEGREFDGKDGVHYIVLGLLVLWKSESKTYGWCTRTNAHSLLNPERFIGSEDTYALPGETVEITVNIEKKILTFSLPRYGPLPFLTVELQLAGGELIYPWAQLYNKSYDNAVTISAYI